VARLTAIPNAYATAWACLFGNLDLKCGQTLLIRGATSALGQAALNIAAHAGSRSSHDTQPSGLAKLESLGAETALVDAHDLSRRVRDSHPAGIDAVLDLVGKARLLDSLAMVRRHGRVCLAGFLGGLSPLESFNPLLQLPSGVHFSFFGSFVFGTPEFPLSDIPFQEILDRVAHGVYQAKPPGPLCSMRFGTLTGSWSQTRQTEKLS